MIKNAELSPKKAFPMELAGLVYFMAVVIAGIMLVYQPARIAHLNQEIRQLEKQLKDLKLRNEDLKRTVATMESLTYIEAQARNVLGMVEPEQVKSVVVNTVHEQHLPAAEETHEAAEPAPGILAWFNRIAEFMKQKIAVAKGLQ